jgi:hypothetical protein
MMARRGEVDSDPVAFALTDRKSILVGAMVGGIILLARYAPLGGMLATILPA